MNLTKRNMFFAVVSVLLMLSCPVSIAWAQAVGNEKPQAPAKSTVSAQPHSGDSPDLLRETQLTVQEPGYAGLVWWIPFEFWQHAMTDRGLSPDEADKNFAALKDYIVIGTFAAKVGGLGGMDFIPPAELEKNIFVRAASGDEFAIVTDPAQDAKNLAAMMKPMLASAMGKAGENFDVLFFPARDKHGNIIADAQQKGTFSIVLKNIVGVPESVYEWRLPLTSVSPPKFCPVGKERVNANWHFCPWHGVALNKSADAQK
jgi:hypothetical protein